MHSTRQTYAGRTKNTRISHRRTPQRNRLRISQGRQTHTDFCPAISAGQKQSSLREGNVLLEKINEITYAINGAVYEVNRVLGTGFVEKILV